MFNMNVLHQASLIGITWRAAPKKSCIFKYISVRTLKSTLDVDMHLLFGFDVDLHLPYSQGNV